MKPYPRYFQAFHEENATEKGLYGSIAQRKKKLVFSYKYDFMKYEILELQEGIATD